MLHCRIAQPQDATHPDLRALVTEGLAMGGPSELVHYEKLCAFLAAIAVRPHYSAVAVRESGYVAYIGGMVVEHPWMPRSVLNLVGWYSREHGAGVRLLRRAMAWVQDQPHITTVLLTVPSSQLNAASRIVARINPVVRVIHTLSIGV